MEQEIKENLKEIKEYLRDNLFELNSMANNVAEAYDLIEIQSRNCINDIDNLKRELKRDGLYSNKLEEFLDNYMKYYNK